MIETLDLLTKYISGLYTLPWILVGFIVTTALSRFFGEERINKLMKKIGLILLYVFVPLLLFRVFLNVDFNENEIIFTITCFIILALMYILAYLYAKYQLKKQNLKAEERKNYLITILTNQGRSSAFIGGAMLSIPAWSVLAALYMSIGAIFLFAIIPYLLSYLHGKDVKEPSDKTKIKALPWYLKIFPWYLIMFAFASVIFHGTTGLYLQDFGDAGIVYKFITGLTIPAALYYVGAGIHPNDLKKNELKKLFFIKTKDTKEKHWVQIKTIFFLTVILTPILTAIVCVPLLLANILPPTWFAVIMINSFLPITSTNMFLIPYGINKKVTALSVTWTTIICVPIVVALIAIFGIYFV